MSTEEKKPKQEVGQVTGLYNELADWPVNMGDKTIHAKRMPGKFRTFKTITESFWLILFLAPYMRWNGAQALLMDVNNRQFHFFSLTILPQDIWMVSLLLLLMAMSLFAVTSVASRAFCGYFCFQSTWVDWFTWVEEKIEGRPNARVKLDAAPMNADKFRKKFIKHSIWLIISFLTGVSVTIWLEDAYVYWNNLMHFDLSLIEWSTLFAFTFGTYYLAGFMREQACMWLCPYCRIQAVMADSQTILPAYDESRGEPRGRMRRGTAAASDAKLGDCIDCFQCVHVCPTGVDIREGQQIGCITCGLCIDACDSVMDKIGRPHGLIRYASLDELEGKPVHKLYQHPRTWVYITILFLALCGIIYGLSHLGAMTMRVEPERQPLFVRMSDGSIQNKYNVKVLNKTPKDMQVVIRTVNSVPGQIIVEADKQHLVRSGKEAGFSVFIKAPKETLASDRTPLKFEAVNVEDENMKASYESVFNGPEK